jgi:hypothetical protein
MSPWFETAGVALLAGIGWLAGLWFSKLPKPYWAIGWCLPLVVVVLYAMATRDPSLSFVPPISWMMIGRTKFAVIGLITAMVLTTPLSRLPRRRERIYVQLLMVTIVCTKSLWPFLAPAFNREQLHQLKTVIDADGVCMQGTPFNCGPAAAVTALRKLGFPAEEGELAILAHTTSAAGTPADDLAIALQRRYGSDGLVAEYRQFASVAELKAAGLTVAVIKFGFLIDHFVAVLEVTDKLVIVGDPATGRRQFTHPEFEEIWRHLGVTLRRSGAGR